MTDGRTDGPTDGRTNGRTDKASYRDAWMHLKKIDNFSRSTRYSLMTLDVDERVVTWEGLGDALTGFETGKASGLVRDAANGLERSEMRQNMTYGYRTVPNFHFAKMTSK